MRRQRLKGFFVGFLGQHTNACVCAHVWYVDGGDSVFVPSSRS